MNFVQLLKNTILKYLKKKTGHGIPAKIPIRTEIVVEDKILEQISYVNVAKITSIKRNKF
jgi:hypothetical protein